jgi:hypothetical protein
MALLVGTTTLVEEGTTNAETPTLLCCWAPSHERRQRSAVVLEIPAMNFIVALMNIQLNCATRRERYEQQESAECCRMLGGVCSSSVLVVCCWIELVASAFAFAIVVDRRERGRRDE